MEKLEECFFKTLQLKAVDWGRVEKTKKGKGKERRKRSRVNWKKETLEALTVACQASLRERRERQERKFENLQEQHTPFRHSLQHFRPGDQAFPPRRHFRCYDLNCRFRFSSSSSWVFVKLLPKTVAAKGKNALLFVDQKGFGKNGEVRFLECPAFGEAAKDLRFGWRKRTGDMGPSTPSGLSAQDWGEWFLHCASVKTEEGRTESANDCDSEFSSISDAEDIAPEATKWICRTQQGADEQKRKALKRAEVERKRLEKKLQRKTKKIKGAERRLRLEVEKREKEEKETEKQKKEKEKKSREGGGEGETDSITSGMNECACAQGKVKEYALGCGHMVCAQCRIWVETRKQCTICRKKISFKKIIKVFHN